MEVTKVFQNSTNCVRFHTFGVGQKILVFDLNLSILNTYRSNTFGFTHRKAFRLKSALNCTVPPQVLWCGDP
jgi:hypothetical protein